MVIIPSLLDLTLCKVYLIFVFNMATSKKIDFMERLC